MIGVPPRPKLLAATFAALCCGFGWAAWLTFTRPPLRVSGWIALASIAAAAEVLALIRGPGTKLEKIGLAAAAASLGVTAAEYAATALAESARVLEGSLCVLAAALFALAAGQRLRTAPPRRVSE